MNIWCEIVSYYALFWKQHFLQFWDMALKILRNTNKLTFLSLCPLWRLCALYVKKTVFLNTKMTTEMSSYMVLYGIITMMEAKGLLDAMPDPIIFTLIQIETDFVDDFHENTSFLSITPSNPIL